MKHDTNIKVWKGRIDRLIAKYRRKADSKWAAKEDLSEMYEADANDFNELIRCIEDGKFSRARNVMVKMDTLPREEFISTFTLDFEDADATEFIKKAFGITPNPAYLKMKKKGEL